MAPFAKFLIKRDRLESTATGELEVGYDARNKSIDYFAFPHAILAVHVSAVFGFLLHAFLEQAGIKLPLFVTCLFAGIVLSNSLPYLLPKAKWPMRTPALALIADISLGATPTAIANMTAVTQRHGPSHIAFLVVPPVGAFFIDIANAAVTGLYLKWL